jgi:transcriptional regulator with XRE-family HTH domain
MKISIDAAARVAIAPKPETPADLNAASALMRELREVAGMKQKDVADLLGISQGTIANMEKGEKGVTFDQLEQLADHLGVEIVIEVRAKPNGAADSSV